MAINATILAMLDTVLTWCGACAIGETPSSACEDLAYSEFLSMLSEWDAEEYLALRTRESKSLAIGVSSVEIGSTAGKWNIGIPTVLLSAKVTSSDGHVQTLHIQSDAEYNASETLEIGGPTAIYYDRSAVKLYLNATLSEALTLEIFYTCPLYDAATSAVSTKAGNAYWNAFNLALRLRADGYYEKKAAQIDYQLAENAKQAIRRLNAGPAPRLTPTTGMI